MAFDVFGPLEIRFFSGARGAAEACPSSTRGDVFLFGEGSANEETSGGSARRFSICSLLMSYIITSVWDF